ncbi:hypothetical protein [Amycolatopsis eburnea]|uniref:Uncharacterized protein n=1 Tax=Amycolatopsis eburnea TaxID=2267691 RepID=A0A427TF07_9PSEU|nr:hypothetical protein [Amycolatopsis eburnea]RSD21473.1 hypothetical protein EIY87_11600 [Amycolatopsis eburnea]
MDAINESIFPGIVLTLFLLHGFVTSWLDVGKKTIKAARAAKEIGDRITSTPRGRLGAALVVSALVLVLEAAWAFAAVVMGNILYYAYYKAPAEFPDPQRNFLSLPPHELLYRIDWLGYSFFSSIYAPLLLVLLVLTVAWPAWIGNLGVWIANLPMVVLVVTTAFAVFIELVLDVRFGGAPIAAVFALASLAAFSAAARLRGQWSVLLGSPA